MIRLFSLLLLMLMGREAFADNTPRTTIPSKVTDANVYYGRGAELTHKTKVALQKGQQLLVITHLSTSVDESSLQIACPDGIVLMNYNYALVQPDGASTALSPAVKKLQDSIKTINKQIAANQHQAQTLDEVLTKTAKLLEAYTASDNKNISGTDVIKLVDYYNNKIEVTRQSLYNLMTRREELQAIVNDLQMRINQLSSRQSPVTAQPTGQLVLQLLVNQPQDAQFVVSYFTRHAGWVPTYDLRVKSIQNSLALSYKATVTQTTGIDWNDVKLTLTTANPNLGTNIPGMHPWKLQLYTSAPTAYTANDSHLEEVVVTAFRSNKASRFAGSPTSNIAQYTSVAESRVYNSFQVNLPYNIPSDGRSYSVAIKDEQLEARFRNLAMPRLDPDAFLTAELLNWETLNLLPGEANIIMDNVYLGKSHINPITAEDTLVLSLGRDKRVNVQRKLVKEYSKTRFIGSNRIEDFTYEITVRNNKKEPVTLSLKEQVPLTTVKEISVDVKETAKAKYDKEAGELSWDIALAPGEVKTFRYAYEVKYPKDERITNLR